jgi:pSer/pThr/pTyr-binding forkhead associated (FHA) protein
MGTLEASSGGARTPLRPDTLVGRSDRTDVRIDDRAVSSEHARIRWTGRAWVLRDLGSRNGTWVNGARLETGGSIALAAGAVLAFGSDTPRFRLVSAGPPAVSAVDASGVRRFGTPDLLALPDEADPQVVVVGDGGVWRVETESGERPVVDGEVLQVAGASYTLSLPEAAVGTWDRDLGGGAASLVDTALHFRVSLDEEHVELTVEVGGRRHPLGSRSHHYLLLVLARLRQQDAGDASLPGTAQGWVGQEELIKMLGAREGGLHTSVFRARAELSELGITDAAGLVERRKGSRQLRLGVGRVTVEAI